MSDVVFNDVLGYALDIDQKTAVLQDENTSLVIAGAGSGKTLTVCGKLKYLLSLGVDPKEVLLLTFSDKSKQDLEVKAKQIDTHFEASTFHALGLSIIKEYNSLRKPRFSYLGKRKTIFTEHRVDDYKTDVYIQDSKTIIEIKSIISTTNSGLFPTVYSERTIKQLQKLQELMLKGYKVAFIIVSLTPYLMEVSIDNDTEFYKEFVTCIKQGMIAKAYTCRLSDDAILIEKEIPILLK